MKLHFLLVIVLLLPLVHAEELALPKVVEKDSKDVQNLESEEKYTPTIYVGELESLDVKNAEAGKDSKVSIDLSVSTCGIIDTPGVYTLMNDLVSGNGQSCIIIDSSDVTLDCLGHTITGNGQKFSIYEDTSFSINGNSGILVDTATNVMINNCEVKEFNQGISVVSQSQASITNSIARNNGFSGIIYYQSQGTINSVDAYSNPHGIAILDSDVRTEFSSIYGNLFGFYIIDTVNSVVDNTKIYDNGLYSFLYKYATLYIENNMLKDASYFYDALGTGSLLTLQENYYLKQDSSGFSENCVDIISPVDGLCDTPPFFIIQNENVGFLIDFSPRYYTTAGPACGDSTLMLHEECDDGNRVSGDGCSDVCRKEAIMNNDIISCGAVIDQPGNYYIPNGFYGNSFYPACIEIKSSNVNVNCNNNYFYGAGPDKFLVVNNSQNVELHNCDTNWFMSAVESFNSDVSIFDSEFYEAWSGHQLIAEDSNIEVYDTRIKDLFANIYYSNVTFDNVTNYGTPESFYFQYSNVNIWNSFFEPTDRLIQYYGSNITLFNNWINVTNFTFSPSSSTRESSWIVSENTWLNPENEGFSQLCSDNDDNGFCDYSYRVIPHVTDTNPRYVGIPQICGDNQCTGTETCNSCSVDCGVCPVCGDGICEALEECSTCSQDCGVCPATNLLTYYPLENSYQDVVAGINASCIDLSFCPENTSGYIGNSNYFDGSDYLFTESFPNSPGVSLSTWVKPTTIYAEFEHIVARGDSFDTLDNQSFSLKTTTGYMGYLLSWRVYTEDGRTSYVTMDLLDRFYYPVKDWTPNQWQHVVGTYDGEYLKLYVNGELKNYTNLSGTLNSATSPLVIGGADDGTIYRYEDNFRGSIDEVKVYDHALTSQQVLDLYQDTTPAIVEPECIIKKVYWHDDQVIKGQVARIYIQAENCEDKEIAVELRSYFSQFSFEPVEGAFPNTITGNSGSMTWIADMIPHPYLEGEYAEEYRAVAYVADFSGDWKESSGLTVQRRPGKKPGPIPTVAPEDEGIVILGRSYANLGENNVNIVNFGLIGAIFSIFGVSFFYIKRH